MSRVKGCVNEECVVFKKKITYKESEKYCSKCGNPLSYVCKKCYTPLDEQGTYCVFHQAEKDDRKDKSKQFAIGILGTALSTGAIIATKGKDLVKTISKLK